MKINIENTKRFTKLPNRLLIISLLLLFFSFNEVFSYWDKITNIPAPYNNTKGWLEFWFLEDNPDYGWICGFNGMVIRTTDGGDSWQGSIVPNADQLESITFTDKLTGYVSGTNVWGYGAIYKSVDGGISWREITDVRRTTQLWGNFFLDNNNGIVIGGGCDYTAPLQFFRTTDGGSSWSLYQTPPSFTGLSDVVLYPSGLGYATSSGYLWRTTDGGFSWANISQSGAIDWQEDLHIKGRTILVPYSAGCYGALDDGGVRISTNLGNSWTQYHVGSAMFGAWLLDDRTGWVCGHNSSLLYTSNAGRTWESRNCGIDPGEVLDDFWFINDTTGFVCGKNVYRYAIPKNIQTNIISSSQSVCEGDTVTLAADGKYFHYEWSTGSRDSSIKVTKSGTYELTVYNSICDTVNPATINIQFFPRPELELMIDGDTVICQGDSLLIWAKTNTDLITWSTGQTSDSIYVKTEGTYKITARNEYGCQSEAEVFVRMVELPTPRLTLKGRDRFCIGDSTIIEATPGYKYYMWYDGKGNEWLTVVNYLVVGNSGDYYCIAFNEEDCEGGGEDTIHVTVINEVNRLLFSFPESKEFDLDSTYFPNMICRTMKIKNATKKDWVIDLPYLFHNISFSFPLSQFPIRLLGGDSIELKVCYSPTILGEERDSVLFDDVCNPHYLVLKGYSLANNYSSASICNVPVIGVTSELPVKYGFSTSEPFPNPANQIVSVPFNKIASSVNSDDIETAELYDIYGNMIMRAERNNTLEATEENQKTIIGEFRFNIEDINSGTYLIIIRAKTDVIRYNLKIIK